MLEEQLHKHFGFAAFKEGQREVVAQLLAGESAVAIFPTGAGKSLCYQLPALLLPGLTLVVSPLLALMKDQVEFLQAKKIPAARLDSTLDRQAFSQILDDARQGRLKILMISVERFRNERFRLQLQRMPLALLVIDEAHCISEWGHNFRPEYLKLPDYRREFAIAQTLLLTATATPPVVADMCAKFAIAPSQVTQTGFYRPNLFLQITPAPETTKEAMLLARLRDPARRPAIVYVTQQKTAERLAAYLSGQGLAASAYHAGLKNEEREGIQQRFMAGEIDCVTATIAFGMGIDKGNIRGIIHYDLPKSLEGYSQEIGRAGRDGQPALCEVLVNLEHLTVLENFVYGDTPESGGIAKLLTELKQHSPGPYEIKLFELSRRLNIRPLPLKTLLVYLEAAAILLPRFSYMESYSFKQRRPAAEIIHDFQGERRLFVQALFAQCQSKKVWTYIDIPALMAQYGADRQRIVTALEYFAEKGWIALESKQSKEVFEALAGTVDVAALSEEISQIFMVREAHEIARLRQMLTFFTGSACFSFALAEYFGQHLSEGKCGHCSACRGEKVILPPAKTVQPLADYDFKALTKALAGVSQERLSSVALARFLCGIATPALGSQQVKQLAGFGALEQYSFPEVKAWVDASRAN
ncbi:MAG: RecQ family ATP-dependent DNA helicase [Desulfobulbaceae bacterium]|nr:RecQ family ATP-dependent DNA helicase [Desulfobulbaceae bacterium]